jgi:prepilin-type N-terminal cleavage/methylation domain-containing protein
MLSPFSLKRPRPIATSGFTLIELAIVIAVIAILASIAIQRFSDVGANAERTTVRDFVAKLRSAQAQYTYLKSQQPKAFTDFVKAGAISTSDNPGVSLSLANFGKGLCTMAEAEITCPTTAFPKLAAEGTTVQVQLQGNTIVSNVN